MKIPLDIAACYELMMERVAKNAKFDLLGFIRKRIGQEIEEKQV